MFLIRSHLEDGAVKNLLEGIARLFPSLAQKIKVRDTHHFTSFRGAPYDEKEEPCLGYASVGNQIVYILFLFLSIATNVEISWSPPSDPSKFMASLFPCVAVIITEFNDQESLFLSFLTDLLISNTLEAPRWENIREWVKMIMLDSLQ